MKAVLEYYNHIISRDGRQMFRILAERKIEVIKTKTDTWTSDVRVTIRIKDWNELNLLVSELNKYCPCGVRIVKVRGDGVFNRLRRKTDEERI